MEDKNRKMRHLRPVWAPLEPVLTKIIKMKYKIRAVLEEHKQRKPLLTFYHLLDKEWKNTVVF